MKNITQVIGGKQGLFKEFFEIQQFFEEQLGGEQKTFIKVLQVIEYYSPCFVHHYRGIGRRSYEYMNFFRAFFALCHFDMPDMKTLVETLLTDPNLRQLCGFQKVPSRSTFSRRLRDFSNTNVMDKILERMVKQVHEKRPVIHVCRDSTAIEAREKPRVKPEKTEKKVPKKRGRRPKGAEKPEKEQSVLAQQGKQPVDEIISTLNHDCAWGCKKNSQGKVSYWKGYKLHLDVSDAGFPLSACVTAANVHDSQVAIALEKMTMSKVRHCYSVMDAAYDAQEIKRFIQRHRRVPIIDPKKKRNGDYIPLDPAKQERYKIRTTVERAYSHLKDNLIPKKIYVRGISKVTFILMITVLCLAAQKYLIYFDHALS